MNGENSFIDGQSFDDDVGGEAHALVERYRLLEQLASRRDLRGAELDPALVAEMRRQLVSGVDFPFCGAHVGWMVRPGIRVERLIFSPWLDDVEKPAGAFKLPESVDDFVTMFARQTGITADHEDLMIRNYKTSPRILGKIAMRVRDSEPYPWPSYRHLMSRHFEDAARGCALLTNPRVVPQFNRPAIDGFKLLAEIEREALISLDLADLNNAWTIEEVRDLLESADVDHLRSAITASPQLRRILAYALIATDALHGYHRRDVAKATPWHPASWLTAAASGRVTRQTGDVEAVLTDDGEIMRGLAATAFAKPKGNLRTNPLYNGVATFWGMDLLTLNRIARVDLGSEFRGGKLPGESVSLSSPMEDRSQLAQIILRHVDRLTAETIEERARKHQKAVSKAHCPSDETPLINPQKQAAGYSKYFLPPRDKFGSETRFDPTLWDAGRYNARGFWPLIMNRNPLLLRHFNLSRRELEAFDSAVRRICGLFGRAFGLIGDETIATKVVSDLATGVSALSANRSVSPALRDLLDVLADAGIERFKDFRHAAHRYRAGTGDFLRQRVRSGKPSVDSKKRRGTERSNRYATRRRKDQNDGE